jgi:2-C-methyl-D-erythritol 4-phosphate cytidylyltransferase
VAIFENQNSKNIENMAFETGAVILAGGSGQRFHGQKQFVSINGKPLWRHVFDKAIEVIDKSNVVVVGVDVPGGSTRSLSVINGLAALNPCQKVVILEAARPMVTIQNIETLVNTDADSITFVAPCVDTIIMRNKSYLDRKDCFRLQTPQAFNFQLLKDAYATDKYQDMTDETRVMFEEYGILPTFVEGGENLFKITYPGDLYWVEHLMKDEESIDNGR